MAASVLCLYSLASFSFLIALVGYLGHVHECHVGHVQVVRCLGRLLSMFGRVLWTVGCYVQAGVAGGQVWSGFLPAVRPAFYVRACNLVGLRLDPVPPAVAPMAGVASASDLEGPVVGQNCHCPKVDFFVVRILVACGVYQDS